MPITCADIYLGEYICRCVIWSRRQKLPGVNLLFVHMDFNSYEYFLIFPPISEEHLNFIYLLGTRKLFQGYFSSGSRTPCYNSVIGTQHCNNVFMNS